MHRSKTIRCLDHAVASCGVAALLKLRQSVKRIPTISRQRAAILCLIFAPEDFIAETCSGDSWSAIARL
jgi:hypothetical protein